MPRFLFRPLLSSLLLATALLADTAVVKRNVTVRPDPSTDNKAITTLGPGDRVMVASPKKKKGYLQVVTADKQKGWVWAANVNVEESPDEPETRTIPKNRPDATDTCIAGSTDNVKHVGPPQLYPDPAKATGCAATLDVDDLTKEWTEGCPSGKDTCSYSQAHRRVSKSERTNIYDKYEVEPGKRNIDHGEIDHFYPLCAGGSNSESNLWYQPITNEWNGKNFGFKEKDKLEAWICRQIKAHKLEPQDAFDRITKDWVKFYKEEIASDEEVKDQVNDDE